MDKIVFNKAFGEHLKKQRVSKGLTQIDLASAMNINPQNISAIERGEVTPTILWIHRLCESLDIKVSVFIEEFYERL